MVKSFCEVFFNWFWLHCWCNIIGVFWFVDVPVSCVRICDYKCRSFCYLVLLESAAIVEYVPVIFSCDVEEFCGCFLSSLIGVVVAGVFCVTLIFKICTSFYVFREIVELSPLDRLWVCKMPYNIDSCQICISFDPKDPF